MDNLPVMEEDSIVTPQLTIGGPLVAEKFGTVTMMLGDNMDLLAALPDKCFDLVIADPPYGDAQNIGEIRNLRGRFKHYAPTPPNTATGEGCGSTTEASGGTNTLEPLRREIRPLQANAHQAFRAGGGGSPGTGKPTGSAAKSHSALSA